MAEKGVLDDKKFIFVCDKEEIMRKGKMQCLVEVEM